ncbi:MAG: hypothetical protein ABSG31_07880 [Tepidisphaeraceae bacterium]|jgi:hypothetical protein
MTAPILTQLRQLGWHISVHRVNGTIELHAVKLDGTADPLIARCDDGDGPDEEYRAACLLMEACGIELDG